MTNNNNDSCWKYRKLILNQIIVELNLTEENLQLIRDRLNKS